MKKIFGQFFLAAALVFIFSLPAMAYDKNIDSDKDGLPDEAETAVFSTDPNNSDTDGDGYKDGIEVKNNFSPLKADKTVLADNDFDQDGLSDRLEIAFGADPASADTDGDGHKDGGEVKAGYSPTSTSTAKLKKRIEVTLAKQELSYFLGDVSLGSFQVSSGVKSMPTPKGTFTIANKKLKAWSSYGLWMPYWLGLKGQNFGLHELPYWPDGRREGEKSLGHPASHGCVRLGRQGQAKALYEFAEVGTPVIIK